jgi:hypothetical protein
MNSEPESTPANKLLEEGANSYPQAMYALSQFRRLVQEACVEAMKRSLPNVGAALGLRLEAKQVKRDADPDKLDPDGIDGSGASLGARIRKPGGAKYDLLNYVYWGGVPPLFAGVSVVFEDPAAFNRAQARMPQQKELECSPDEKEILYWRCVRPEDLAPLESLLVEMNQKWEQIWRDVGGVKQFLGKD